MTMGSQTKRNNQDKQKLGRTGALLLKAWDDAIGDLISVASMREEMRLFGVDRVRGL